MKWVYDDGGRKAAGYRGDADDCAVRSIAIATGIQYQEVYDALNLLAKKHERGGKKGGISSSRNGVYIGTVRRYLESLGWRWTPKMGIGTGCRVHVREGEVPNGPVILSLSQHLTAIVRGEIRDTEDPSRDGTRCVYGYFSPPVSAVSKRT